VSAARVYLDHHAATPLGPGVGEAMRAARGSGWANPYSTHHEGRAARALFEEARRAVARALGAAAADVVLTGGGTEACNLGVLGLAGESVGDLLVLTSAIEHPAVSAAVAALAARGATVEVRDALRQEDLEGLAVRADEARAAGMRVLWAVQAVNHETGTRCDVATLARRAPWALGVVDASQALGKLDLSRWGELGVAVAVSGAKIGATAGAGALLAPRGRALTPRALGGGQERGRRAGTPDVAACAALGAACAGIEVRLSTQARIGALRDRLEAGLEALGGVVNGARSPRVGTVTNVSFPGPAGAAPWRSATLVAALDLEGLSVSAGAACSSGVDAPSPVVAHLHADEPWRAGACVRFSLGPETSSEDVEAALGIVARVLARRAG
jgi:cysteine desulfurase